MAASAAAAAAGAAMANLAIRKRLTIHLEGEMATRVDHEDYHDFEDCNVMILFFMMICNGRFCL